MKVAHSPIVYHSDKQPYAFAISPSFENQL